MAKPQPSVNRVRSDSLSRDSISSEMSDEFFNGDGRDHVNALLAYAENDGSPDRDHDPTVMAKGVSPFNLATCVRPNILALQPYRCARE